jgi:hypothetical protein
MGVKEGQIPREEMGFIRKTADNLAGVNNTVDKGVIVVGAIMLSAPVVAFGLLSLWTGNYIRDNHIRRRGRGI